MSVKEFQKCGCVLNMFTLAIDIIDIETHKPQNEYNEYNPNCD